MTHPTATADARARTALGRAAMQSGLAVAGGGIARTSSRLCLAVEHGDYNGTDLFGVGTDRFLWIAWHDNDRGTVRAFSANEPSTGVVEFSPAALPEPAAARRANTWARFALGAAWVLRRRGHALPRGLDLVVYSEIPGGGMSRSAALAIDLLLVLMASNGIAEPSRLELARLAQAVENDYVGSPCGLLDQVMICHARAGFGTHYSPRGDRIAHVPLGCDASQLALLCLDTGRARSGLEHATYPVRRRECDEATALLADLGITCLADVDSPARLAAAEARLGSRPELLARVRYVHEAWQRFPQLLLAWQRGDLAALGRCFRSDGLGLRDLYAISGRELETMCDLVRTVPGVFGERMLGGGDCGTAGALAMPEAVPAVRAAVATGYPRSHPSYADRFAVHELRTADGIAMQPSL